MTRTLLLAAAALALTAPAAVAQTSSSGVLTTSRTVSVADLRLMSPEGRRAAEARLDDAIQAVCGARTRVLQLETRRQSCAREALDQARAQIGGRDLAQIPQEVVIVRDRRF